MARMPLAWSLLCTLGCRALSTGAGLPAQHTIVRDQLIVYSDFAVPARHRLLEDLGAQRETLSSKLGLTPSDEPIHVYLFASAADFAAFAQSHFPQYPKRRAFFVETDTRLAVYAAWGDHVAEDLRHEVAHGYLHSVVPNIPLWLDEGLAEYFEVPRGHGGLNTAHLPELQIPGAAGPWFADLSQLEGLASATQLRQIDYAEAWAWTHFLLETTPERQELLRSYLQSLRREGAHEPLSARLKQLHADYDRQLTEYVRRLTPAEIGGARDAAAAP